MKNLYGQQSSFSASDDALRMNIEDLISKYPDYKFPVLKRWNSKVFSKEVLSYKYEWSNRDLRPIKALLVNATLNNSATSFIVDTAGVFNKDDVVENKRTGERLLVVSVTGGVNVAVTRGFQGSTAAAMVANDVLVRIGVSAPQGALADHMVINESEDLFNYTQIFEDVVEMSDSQYKGFVRGDESSAQLIERKQQELMEGLHLSLFLGIRYRDVATKRSTLGGVKYFVDTYAPGNVVDFGGAGTWSSDVNALDKFEDAVEKIALRMGAKPTIYASYKALRKVRLLQDDTIRTTPKDSTRGIGVVDTLASGMGDLDIVQLIDRSTILDDYIFLVDDDAVGYKAHKGRGWGVKSLPFAGDGHLNQVLGEYTFKVEAPKASVAYIRNLGVTA